MENIQSVAHCATRLRFMVNDKEQIDQEAVENVNKVKGAFFNSGQYQVILGTGTVNQIYDEVDKLGVNATDKSEQSKSAAKDKMHCSVPSGHWAMCLCQSSRSLLPPACSWVFAGLLCKSKSWPCLA